MRLLLIGLAILASTGCSNNETVIQIEPERTFRQYTNIHHPVQDATLYFETEKRVGAAYNTTSYIHVLTPKRATSKLEDLPNKAQTADGVASKLSIKDSKSSSIDAAKSIQKATQVSYSIYEMTRWEHYCGHGKMNEKDWAFVADQGRDNLPKELKEQCTVPAYTRQDYLKAWNATCSDSDLNSYKIIREKTLAPAKLCNS